MPQTRSRPARSPQPGSPGQTGSRSVAARARTHTRARRTSDRDDPHLKRRSTARDPRDPAADEPHASTAPDDQQTSSEAPLPSPRAEPRCGPSGHAHQPTCTSSRSPPANRRSSRRDRSATARAHSIRYRQRPSPSGHPEFAVSRGRALDHRVLLESGYETGCQGSPTRMARQPPNGTAPPPRDTARFSHERTAIPVSAGRELKRAGHGCSTPRIRSVHAGRDALTHGEPGNRQHSHAHAHEPGRAPQSAPERAAEGQDSICWPLRNVWFPRYPPMGGRVSV